MRPQAQNPSVVGASGLGQHVHPTRSGEHGRNRLELAATVVVAGDYRHLRPGAGQVQQRPIDDRLGLSRGRCGLEEVSGHQHEVDGVLSGQGNYLAEHGPMLISPTMAPNCLANVPVAGVQQPHRLASADIRINPDP